MHSYHITITMPDGSEGVHVNLYPHGAAAALRAAILFPDAAIHGEMDRVSQALTSRVRELAERYESPLPQMADRAAELEAKVAAHLKTMGFTWN